jgi:hypothetical protein
LNIGRRLAIRRDCGHADRRAVRGAFDEWLGAEARQAGAGALVAADPSADMREVRSFRFRAAAGGVFRRLSMRCRPGPADAREGLVPR